MPFTENPDGLPSTYPLKFSWIQPNFTFLYLLILTPSFCPNSKVLLLLLQNYFITF